MNSDKFKTNAHFRPASKRDSLVAELERDPQLSSAKRQQRTQLLTSSMAHANLERQLATCQTVKSDLEAKLREKEVLVERLERDRRWIAEREQEEREEKERNRKEYDDEKTQTENELRNLRSSLHSLREELADLQDAHSDLSRTSSQTITSQQSQIITLTHQLASSESSLAQTTQTASEHSHVIQELRDTVDSLQSTQTHFFERSDEEADTSVVRDELHRQAEYLRTLELKNARLEGEVRVFRERQVNIEVLREEKAGLERKVRVVDELREKVVRLEAQLDTREERASTFRAHDSPISIKQTQTLSDLRLAHARLLEEHGCTSALLRRREAEMADLERSKTQAQTVIDTLEADIRALQLRIESQETQGILARREVEFLQALVTSYEGEDEEKSERNGQLKCLFDEYKTITASRQIELEMERSKRHEAEQALKSFSQTHLSRIEELEQELFELGGEIGAGRHVPPGVRVLCMKENPDQEWVDLRQSAMDRLKSENGALLKRLKQVEKSVDTSTSSEELVPRESWEWVNKEKTDLEDVVLQKEKRLLRLQEVFKSKSAEFREAIASILGLKLAFYPNGQVRVTSVYDLSASFVFQPCSNNNNNKDTRMQLVAQGEGGPQDLPNLMRYWIETEQCIPGFLASVTLECYDKSKDIVVKNKVY